MVAKELLRRINVWVSQYCRVLDCITEDVSERAPNKQRREHGGCGNCKKVAESTQPDAQS